MELTAFQLYEGEPVDPLFGDVSLLLNFDAGLTDSSTRQRQVAASGGAQISAEQVKFGAAAVRFNGSGGFLSTPLDSDLRFDQKSFTVQCWLYPVRRDASYPVVFENGLYAPGYLGLYMGHKINETRYQVAIGSSGFPNIQSVSEIVYGRWCHIALERDGAEFRLFIDGVLEGVYTSSISLSGDSDFRIGGSTASSCSTNCFMDDFRVTMLTARGSVVPVAPFPSAAISNRIRVDDLATLSCTLPPVSGVISALQDGDPATKVRMNARDPGFALVWDFGAGVAKEVISVALGASQIEPLFLSHFDLQYSEDALRWTQLARLGRFGWPGSGALLPQDSVALPLAVRVGRDSFRVAAGAAGPAGLSVRKSLAAVAKDLEVGGAGRIYGTTKTKGSPANLPTKARVVLLHQRSKLPVREVWSDPITGDFAFEGIDTRQEFLTLAEDAAGNFRPVAASRLAPEVAP